MVHAIIDIGSNTIRLAIYKIEDEKLTVLLNKKHIAGLAAHMKKGKMTPDGINKACAALMDFKFLLENFHIENVSAFATAALRNVSNSTEAVAEIVERTGLPIVVLSGSEEATLDFIGATHVMDAEDGLLVDIGGASTELVIYQNSEIVDAISIPIGSLNAYGQYVDSLLPDKTERKAIKEAVLAELEDYIGIEYKAQPIICGVGGTIRAASKINNYLFNLPAENQEIKAPNVKKMIKLLENDEDDDFISSETLDVLLKTVPDRIETILPGMIILHTITKYFKGELIVVSNFGVREGYLYHNVLKKNQDEELLDVAVNLDEKICAKQVRAAK
ncbi:Ppx/GppA phosphatase family protein [Anaerosinus massiliensis]|uniref:Ppx/GppA phosphatase family protein n=1 Tax=Massilibacillus massiliensis TaxID=1806837 RepID=UPI000A4C26A6|nr:phosphatase [Massilibacillus massiliensis]